LTRAPGAPGPPGSPRGPSVGLPGASRRLPGPKTNQSKKPRNLTEFIKQRSLSIWCCSSGPMLGIRRVCTIFVLSACRGSSPGGLLPHCSACRGGLGVRRSRNKKDCSLNLPMCHWSVQSNNSLILLTVPGSMSFCFRRANDRIFDGPSPLPRPAPGASGGKGQRKI
jgi:hypothetical protein